MNNHKLLPNGTMTVAESLAQFEQQHGWVVVFTPGPYAARELLSPDDTRDHWHGLDPAPPLVVLGPASWADAIEMGRAILGQELLPRFDKGYHYIYRARSLD